MAKRKSKPEELLNEYRHHIASAQRHMGKAQRVRRDLMVFVQENGGEDDWAELMDKLNAILAEFKQDPTGQKYQH